MKKIILLLSVLMLGSTLTACKADNTNPEEDNNGGTTTPDEVINYNQLTNTTNQNNVFTKMIVNNISDITRQQNVIADSLVTSVYSIPGNGFVESVANKKTAILAENVEIFNYDSLDSNGYYIVNDITTSAQLFKHRGADSQVASYLLDDTAVVKSMSIRNSIYAANDTEQLVKPVNLTGLYAPAGELIKIEISKELAATNPKIYIGSTTTLGEVNNISSDDAYTRMPNRVKELVLTEEVNYVGSPLGGEIYIQSEMDEFDVTISGAVEYMHYIHNLTTKEELSRLYDSTAPMIDIEVSEFIRVNMPKDEITQRETTIYNELTLNLDLTEDEMATYKEEAKSLVIDEIIQLADTLKMYCELSSYICPEDLYRSNSMSLFFDSYVTSTNILQGKNLSMFNINQGRNLFNASFNNDLILQTINKHYWNNNAFIEQGSNDTTSKLLSILAEMLYGEYGDYRTVQQNTDSYSSAGDTLNFVKRSTGNDYEISKYITLIHSFGVETFIKAITTEVNEEILRDRLYVQFSLTTNTNMEFYFEEMLGYTISDTVKDSIKENNFDMYIPVATNLQTGVVIDEKKIYNVQPYGLLTSQNFNINESIVVPTDMDFTIAEISNSKGTISKVNNEYFYSTDLEEVDEFTIKVKVFNDDYEYTTTLLVGVGLQYSSRVITSSTTIFYNNVNNVAIEDLTAEDLAVNTTITLNDPTLKYSVSTGYNGVFVTYAELYFPDTKEYTLNAAGLGDIRIYVGENYNDFEEVANFKQEGSASSYNINDESRTFKINAEQNKRVIIKIVISSVEYSTYQRVEFYLGYLNGSSVAHIPEGWWYGQYTSNPVVNNPTTTFYNNPNNKVIEDLTAEDLTVNTSFTLTDTHLGYNVASGNGVFVTYAELYVPESGEYTFNTRGLGDSRVYIGSDYDNLEEVVNYKNEGTISNFDITDSSRTFTVNAVKGKRIVFKIVISSGAVSGESRQRAEFELGYLLDGEVVSIPSGWWFGMNSFQNEVITSYYKPYNSTSLFSIEKRLTSFTRVDEDSNIIYQTCNLDDKFLTTPGSGKQSMDPGSIVIYKYSQFVTANYFALTSASATEGVLSFFEIHVSNNGVNWTEAFKGVNPYEQYTCLALNDGYTFKYVKLVFTSTYSGNYIDICNFEFQTRCDNLSIVDSPNDFLYTGNANLVDNIHNLNNNVLEFDDRIKFTFTGDSLILFSNKSTRYGVMEVKVNGIVYTIDLNQDNSEFAQQVLTVSCLEYGTYDVEIKVISGLCNIDYIAI